MQAVDRASDCWPGSVSGQHWLLDCSGCRCDAALLARREVLEAVCVRACVEAGLQVVGACFHQFMPAGVTGAVLLAESHLAVHTWPEQRFVTLDVFVCNHERDNRARAQQLAAALQQAFGATRAEVRCVARAPVPPTPV